VLEPQAVEVPASVEAPVEPANAAPVGVQPEAAQAETATAPATEVPTGGPRIGEGATRFSHSGTRYILGFGQDFFGIWDRETPGGPIMRFPRTDEGWAAAWNRFTTWEPRAIEVPQTGTPAPDTRGPSGGPFRSARGAAGATVILISVTMILGLVSAGLWGGHLGTIASFRRGTATIGDLDNSRHAALSADGFMAFFVLIAAIVWLVWQHRAHTNLGALGATQLRYSPGWAVAWWFIPVANIVMPYLTMRELYKASDPQAGSVDWAMRGGGGVLAVWWTARLVTQALFQVGVVFGDRSDFSAMRMEASFFVAGNLVFVVLGVLAILVIRAVDTRQTQRHERMAAWTRSFGQAG